MRPCLFSGILGRKTQPPAYTEEYSAGHRPDVYTTERSVWYSPHATEEDSVGYSSHVAQSCLCPLHCTRHVSVAQANEPFRWANAMATGYSPSSRLLSAPQRSFRSSYQRLPGGQALRLRCTGSHSLPQLPLSAACKTPGALLSRIKTISRATLDGVVCCLRVHSPLLLRPYSMTNMQT